MIRDIADMLKAFGDAESRILAEQSIAHAPTIGAMYEGLTSEVLTRSIPPGLELRVEQGFIASDDDFAPATGQIDCMLVRGQGRRIPHTSSYIWHVRDVIAVLEVKKKLYLKDLEDAYNHLLLVRKAYSAALKYASSDPVDLTPARRAFAEITGQVAPPHLEAIQLPVSLQYLYHALVGEQFAPIRIILGYSGFKSEYMLRKKFADLLQKQGSQLGYGVPGLPQLIIAGNASLVKLGGYPYRASLDNGKWPILASSTENPVRLLLELTWTRLAHTHPINALFGEDLEIETMSPLLLAQAAEAPEGSGNIGWQFGIVELTGKQLSQRRPYASWEPQEVDQTQFAVFLRLCQADDVDVTDPDFIQFVVDSGYTVDYFVEKMIETKLVARDNHMLRLITVKCGCVGLPDGRLVVAEDNTGRLTRWLEKHFSGQTLYL